MWTKSNNDYSLYQNVSLNKYNIYLTKGAFTLANFARDFALSLHVLLNKNYLLSLLNVQASAKSRAKLHQCKHTLIEIIVKIFTTISINQPLETIFGQIKDTFVNKLDRF
jgi:hypothetical protein